MPEAERVMWENWMDVHSEMISSHGGMTGPLEALDALQEALVDRGTIKPVQTHQNWARKLFPSQ